MTRSKTPSIVLDKSGGVGLQRQLVEALKEKIRCGQIVVGAKLASSRELASDLAISRNTVLAAYDQLLGEGYLEARSRSGVYVSSDLQSITRAESKSVRVRSANRPRIDLQLPKISAPIPFHASQPDVGLFPINLWSRQRTRCLRKFGSGLLHYQSRFALGLPILRAALAEYLSESRGVRCTWQQIAITSGSQQALYMLSQILLDHSDRVLMEDPGYPGARHAFELAGAKIMRLPVDEQGAVPPQKPQSLKLIYTTPSRQFPTGARLPVSRRISMIEFAEKNNAWLLEDDYDSEFRYGYPPLPSLHSIDTKRRVIYLGSMSKVLFPALRIGYVVLPESLIDRFESLRLVLDDHGPLIEQATLAEFISSGDFFTHIRRCRKAYAAKLTTFLDSVRKHDLPLEFPFTDGGMNQAGYFLDKKVDDEAIACKLVSNGICVRSLSSYSPNRQRPGLLFGFTAFSHSEIRRGIEHAARYLTQSCK